MVDGSIVYYMEVVEEFPSTVTHPCHMYVLVMALIDQDGGCGPTQLVKNRDFLHGPLTPAVARGLAF